MSTADEPRIDPEEWQAQERGLRAALSGQRAGPDDVDYLRIAEAIASAPQRGPPMRFAREVALRIACHDAGIERWVSRVLLAVLAIAVLAVGTLFGPEWGRAIEQAAGTAAVGWMMAGVGCVSLSWIAGYWRRKQR
ncbi:hypothetical protein [Stenotrophomonas sp. JAI102]|uniref:hypothetical protein n=1 Tax=Stenotrophomonas sp. JAI102 TaxID=2723077 RepID=UPI0015C92076|nr:hypothetical protein [Stenotrophomonas sp. JAI102]NYF35948.1 hypothetical protein [Stenotrophomonas sp. JAI102]